MTLIECFSDMPVDNISACLNLEPEKLIFLGDKSEMKRNIKELTDSGIRIQDKVSGDARIVECDGVFVSIGRKPATELVKDQLELDKAGYVVADESTRTSIPGVFAAGDVRTKALRQVVTAVADGAVAVHFAQEYLA